MEREQDIFTQDKLPFSIRENVIYEDDRADRLAVDIYNALCYFVGDDRKCWPGYAKLAKMARVSKPWAIKGVKQLIDLGYLRKKERHSEDGRQTTNQYHLISDLRSIRGKASLPTPVNSVNPPSKLTLPPRLTQLTQTISNELYKEIYGIFGDHVRLTKRQYQKLEQDFGSSYLQQMIQRLDSYLTDNPRKQWGKPKGYKDHSKTIRNWISRDRQKTGNVVPGNFSSQTSTPANKKRCPQCGHRFQNLSYCPQCGADQVVTL